MRKVTYMYVIQQICTGLFKMIVGVLTTCHTNYTSDSSICIFLFNRTTLPSSCDTPYRCSYMCTLCVSTNINTIIEFVPNCLFWFVPSVLGYLQEEKEYKPDPWRNPIERNHMGVHLQNEVCCVWQVVKTLTIIFKNPVHKKCQYEWYSARPSAREPVLVY
jgi:hypothetical protein